jgi:hypothetical protein
VARKSTVCLIENIGQEEFQKIWIAASRSPLSHPPARRDE